MSEINDIPGWPVISIEMADDAVRVDGEAIAVPPGADAREAAIQATARSAQLLGRAVRVEAIEADGTVYPLVVTPDGTVSSAGPAILPQGGRRGLLRKRSAAAPSAPEPLPAPAPPTATERPAAPVPGPPAAPAPLAAPPAPEPVGEPTPLPSPTGPSVPGPPPPSSAPTPVSAIPPTDPDLDPAPPEAAPAPNTRSASGDSEQAATAEPDRNAVPKPNSSQTAALRAIKAAFDAGAPAKALEIAAQLDTDTQAEGDETASVAAREIRAYVALQAGRTPEAVQLFAAAAMARAAHDAQLTDEPVTSPTRWSWRLVQNAHYSWMQVKDPEEAYELSTFVLGAYSVLGASDAPSAEAARGYAEEIRRSLIML